MADKEQPASAAQAVKWFDAVLSATVAEVDDLFEKFRLSEALMAVYKLFWDEFSSWYLEMVKPAYGEPIDRATYEATLRYFDALLRLLHPFMPFITEELWQHISERNDGDSIMYAAMPKAHEYDTDIIAQMNAAKDIIAGVRTIRLQKNIPNREQLALHVLGSFSNANAEVIRKMAERGIACNVHYKPLPMMTAYKNLGFKMEDYPHAYHQFENEVTLPLHTRLSDEDVAYVIGNFVDIVSE